MIEVVVYVMNERGDVCRIASISQMLVYIDAATIAFRNVDGLNGARWLAIVNFKSMCSGVVRIAIGIENACDEGESVENGLSDLVTLCEGGAKSSGTQEGVELIDCPIADK